MRKRFLTSLIITILCASPLHAEMYKWVDEAGKTHFSDSKPRSVSAEPLELKINTYTHVTIDESIFDVGPEVIMYSASWCGYCKKARRYFNKNKIRFTEYDIEKNARAKRKYDKLHATGVPVILVGKKRMNGFSEEGFERIYR